MAGEQLRVLGKDTPSAPTRAPYSVWESCRATWWLHRPESMFLCVLGAVCSSLFTTFHAQLSDAQLELPTAAVDRFEGWLANVTAQQAEQDPTLEPVFTEVQVKAKKNSIRGQMNYLKRIPKPTPTPTPKPATTDKDSKKSKGSENTAAGDEGTAGDDKAAADDEDTADAQEPAADKEEAKDAEQTGDAEEPAVEEPASEAADSEQAGEDAGSSSEDEL